MLQPPFNPALSDDDQPRLRSPVAPRVSPGIAVYEEVDNNDSLISESQVVELLSEFGRLEELLLNSPRLPLTGKTMVGEDQLLEQMDFIRSHLPLALQTAQGILQQRDHILQLAEQQAQQKITAASQQAFQIANELGIVDRAKAEATQIRQIAQSDCEQLRQQTMVDLEQYRQQHLQAVEVMRQQATAECQDIQRQADVYADQVFQAVEQKLQELYTQVRRSRQLLHPESEISST